MTPTKLLTALLLGTAGLCVAAAETPAQFYYGPVTSYYGPVGTAYYPGFYGGTYVRAPFVSVNVGPRFAPPAYVAPAPVYHPAPIAYGPRRVISRRVITPAGGVVTGYRGPFDDDFEIRYPNGVEVEYEFEDGRWEIEIDD